MTPATIPINGPHSRAGPLNFSITASVTTSVAMTVTGAARGPLPSGTLSMKSKRNGITLTAISMITVPATVGVRIRRSSDRRPASRNWKSDDTMISVASRPGPPCWSAATDTAMNAPDVPIISTYPDPSRPTRRACRMVATPLTRSAPKAPQAKYAALLSALRSTIATVSTTPPIASTEYWRASPAASGQGGFSSGS